MTTRAYLDTIDDLACYFKRPPDKLGPEQIREYTADFRRCAPHGGAEHALRYPGCYTHRVVKMK